MIFISGIEGYLKIVIEIGLETGEINADEK